MNRRIVAGIVSAVAVSMVATGCQPGSSSSHSRSGIVVDRDIESHGYELETKNSSGKHEFKVSYRVYRDCQKGEYYPSCVKSSKKSDGTNGYGKNKKKRSWPWSKKNKSKAKKSSGFSFGGKRKR